MVQPPEDWLFKVFVDGVLAAVDEAITENDFAATLLFLLRRLGVVDRAE